MSHINDLIPELAPEGVVHRLLGEVAQYSTTRVAAADLDNTAFVGVDNLLSNKGGKVDARYLPNTARLTAYEPGDILLGNIRPYLKKVWLADAAGGCSGDVLAIRISFEHRATIAPEFLYYLLSSDDFFAYSMQHAKGAKMPRGSKEAILNYQIPLPPMEVQREIARVLEQFTRLEAELEARRRQYEHYRYALLETSNDVHRVPLEDLFDMRSGRFIAAADISPGLDSEHPFPCYGGNGLRGYVAVPNQEGRRILVGRQGALSGNVHRVNGEFYATEHAIVVTPLPNVEVDIDWAFHMLTAMNLNQYISQGAQPGLAVGTLKALSVPVPPFEAQERIASVLDQFDALVNDLSIGLPAELAARRKQYEHYRDRLLKFDGATA